MSEIQTSTYHAVIATQGLGTMGVDPEWDHRVAEYLKRRTLFYADARFGSSAAVEEGTLLARVSLEQRYGRDYRNDPAAATELAKLDAVRAASDIRQHEEYTSPYWQAARNLATCPAPTLAAALFKAQIIDTDELWNDTHFKGDCMAIVSEDMNRLVPEEAS